MVILEALSGLTTTSEAAERLGVSPSRYYQLEARALEGMMAALEPRPRGPRNTPQSQIKALVEEKAELERELRRHQSLLRQASRSLGLKARKKARKKARTRRGASRTKTVLKTLRQNLDGASDGPTKRDEAAARSDGRKRDGA
ncbi:MAG: helix-turn-helix domain-containing protein [Planctomycetota bacterium]|nr:helix-turn-helix domain-containing protein [Planctomycetota bacterium]